MRRNWWNQWTAGTAAAAMCLSLTVAPSLADPPGPHIQHVLLISVDGMHALDFINCATGVSGVNGGAPALILLRSPRRASTIWTLPRRSRPTHSRD
jgi:hypothetical protein